MELAKIVYEISPKATLRALPVGIEAVVPADKITPPALRKAASKLKKEGYLFTITTKGVQDAHITRLQ